MSLPHSHSQQFGAAASPPPPLPRGLRGHFTSFGDNQISRTPPACSGSVQTASERYGAICCTGLR